MSKADTYPGCVLSKWRNTRTKNVHI